LIQGDQFNDNFVVTETASGFVTVSPGTTRIVPGVGVVPPSTINTTNTPFTTGGAVSTIVIQLPGTTNFDFVQLNGPGKTTPTTIGNVSVTATGANLTFTVSSNAANGVDNSGNLTISDTFSLPPGGMDAALNVHVDNSAFAGISITQTGCCPATVELGNDTVPGPVTVTEGNADGDSITLQNHDVFGPTTLIQHDGGPATYHGNNDSISVTNSSVVNLKAYQNFLPPVDGSGNTITVQNVTVALASFGVITSQGNGAGDTTLVNAVTTSSPPNPNLPLPGPSSIPSISVTQGSGNGDSATVSNSVLPGNITITQSDVSGNKNGDTAQALNDSVGFVQTLNGLPYAGFYGNITIHQGNASGDTALVSGSTAIGNILITQLNGAGDSATVMGGGPDGVILTGYPAPGASYGGNVTITQGTGNGDKATVTGTPAAPLVVVGNVTITQSDVAGNTTGDVAHVFYVNAGFSVPAGQFVFDYNGNVSITQGNGYGDQAVLLGVANTANNVYIVQGDNVFTPNCTPGLSDVAQINGYKITSDISITQGDGNSAGNYVAAIGFDFLGLINNGATASASVSAGGDTYIYQYGYNNFVFLGDPGTYGGPAASFTTVYLDVFTGFGGAFVQVANTTVFFGSLYGIYTIDGAGVNTYFDAGGNTGVTIDPFTFNYT
jgi:hypothetical protein